MDNHSDNNASYELRPEGLDASLNELAMLHRQSATYLDDIADNLKKDNDTAGGYFEELADYHKAMLKDLNGLISGMSAGVHTPSRSSETRFKKREESLNRAVIAKNVTELAELAHENEVAISDAYESVLGNPNVVSSFKETIEDQHQNILVWVNRADRFKTVPQDYNSHYGDDKTEVK